MSVKKVLISCVSNSDPYSEKTSSGPLMNIILKFIETEPFDDIRLFFINSNDIEGRKNIDEKKNDIFKMIELIYTMYGKEMPNIKDYYTNEEQDEIADNYGIYYKSIYKIYQDCKGSNKEIFCNLSSGIPAFKSALMLFSTINNLKQVQVSRTKKEQLLQLEDVENLEYVDVLVKIIENERKYESRTNDVESISTRKLILFQNIESCFKKFDYAGVRDLLDNNENIIDNKDIIYAARNLYYRYVGNDKEAIKSYQLINNKFIDFYPYKEENEIYDLIERYNLINVKLQRDEVNDWLVNIFPMLEHICKYELLRNVPKLECLFDSNTAKLVIENVDITDEKVRTVVDVIKKNKRENQIYTLQDLLNFLIELNKFDDLHLWRVKNDSYFVKNIAKSFRNDAAHDIKNITKEDLINSFKNIKINKYNEDYLKLIEKEDVAGGIQEIIKGLILYISDNDKNVKDGFLIYKNIENYIIKLLTEEVMGGKYE